MNKASNTGRENDIPKSASTVETSPAETVLGVVCGGLGLEGFQQSLVEVGLETSFDPLDGNLRMYMDQVFRSVMTKQTPQARTGLQGLVV